MKYISGKPENVMTFSEKCQKFLKTHKDVIVIKEYVDKKEIMTFGRKMTISKRIIDFNVNQNGIPITGFQYTGLGVLVEESSYIKSKSFVNEMVKALDAAVCDSPFEDDDEK